MKPLFSNKSITVAQLKEWLADANDSDTLDLEISPKWGAVISAHLTRCSKIGRSITLEGFEK